MSGASSAVAASALKGFGLPFTAAQWKELEHQALVYKHLVAGLPVPHDLVILIQRSFDSSASFLNHPGFAHSSYYGKKFDLEPSRCRRTDGKKWRCSRIAYPDSRYCVWHMHRGRNRSRKHVESPSTSQSSSAVISQIATGMSNGGGSLQNDQLHSVADAEGPLFGSIVSKLQMVLTPYAINDKDYFHGLKADERNLSQAAYGSVRDLKVDSYVESRWQLTNFGSHLQSDSPQPGTLQDFELIVDSPMSKQEMQYCPFDSKLDLPEIVQQEHSPMRPFLAEKPNVTDSWFDLDYQRSNKDIFTTQLSMSIPVATSEVYSRNICLPSGESSFLNPWKKSSR